MSWGSNRLSNRQDQKIRFRPPVLLRTPFIDDPYLMDSEPGIWGSQWGEYQPDTALQDTEATGIARQITEDIYMVTPRPAVPPLGVARPSHPIPHLYMMDSLCVDQQQTWIIPSVQPLQRTKKRVTQAGEEETYASIIRRLVTNSGIYALASLVSPLVSLVLAPFLTSHLSRSDYGMLVVLNPTIALVAGITQLGLGIAFFRAYSQDFANSPRDRLDVVSTVVVLLLLIVTPISLAMMLAAPWLSNLLFHSSSFSNLIIIAALVVLLQNLAVPGFAWLRAQSRAVPFAILSVLNLFITLCATIILVNMFAMGVAGVLLATGSGYAIVVVSTLPVMLRRTGLRLRFDIARNLLSFGLSTVPGLLSVWVLQLSDRYLLLHFRSLSQTASYAVAYTLGSVVGPLVIVPFSLAWYSMFYTIARKENAADIFRLVFRWYSIVLLLAVFGISFVATFILNAFFPLAYHSAASIIPLVTLSSMFYGLFDVVVVGVYIQRRLRFNFVFTPIAALVNIGCNLILIPAYGAMGAAIATLIAYAVLAALAYVVNQKIYPLPFEIDLFGLALLIGIVLYAGNNFLIQDQETYIAWGMSLCTFCLYAAGLAFLGKLPPGQKKNKVVKRRKNLQDENCL
ncbi:MAG TPA: lipopolysaccharide biosynthesis protein [Ktedonobacteraceae bacterium]|nr:lipopolysaccharide biosynthesis protein [Ktedonobacteraceae bacterium]